MTLTIDLRPELVEELEARAAQLGKRPDDYVRLLVERNLSLPTFDEILAPVRDQVAASGTTEEELDCLFNEALTEVRRERKGALR